MHIQLLFSSVLVAFVSAPISFACGSDSPDQAPQPQFSVATEQESNVLKLSGSTAQLIFDHLSDLEVRRFDSDFFTVKMGHGIMCVAQSGQQNHVCWEKITDNGEVKELFPYVTTLKDSTSILHLRFKGSDTEQLYNKMSKNGSVTTKDGNKVYFKQRTAISCSKTVKPSGETSFGCSQYLYASGYQSGPGSDPMIGSGTHPVTITDHDVE